MPTLKFVTSYNIHHIIYNITLKIQNHPEIFIAVFLTYEKLIFMHILKIKYMYENEKERYEERKKERGRE